MSTIPQAEIAVPFPDELPPGYAWLPDEPAFDADRHLALEVPASALTLSDLGYDDAEIATKATPFAASAPFRVLSDEGAEIMLDVARRLKQFVRPAGDRIENTVRGGVYRSRWLADLSISPELTAHFASIYGVSVAPHPMPVHLAHLNYEPTTLDTAVDKWHHDTIPLDMVMMVTDPTTTPGGQFEYFLGTKAEMAELRANGELPPLDRVVAPPFDGPGYAIALHGDMVVHRGAPLDAPAERITMVNGYVAADTSTDEQSRSRDLIGIDDNNTLYTEWAKFVAWRSRGRLDQLIADLDFTPNVDSVTAELENAIADVRQAIDEMRAGPRPAEHYER
ncbi:MAG: hypothetical protein AAF467_13180 [Actinomycetota bacterium]